MRFRLILATLIIACCWSCSSEPAVPPPPIPQDSLVAIIAESLILEPAGRELPRQFQDSMYQIYYGRILDQRGYSMDDFITSMQRLQQDPKQLEAVYEEVVEHLQVIETKAGN